MEDITTLADLGVGPNGTIQLEMQSADPVNTPIKTYRPRQEYHMPDVITVRVQTGGAACVYKDVKLCKFTQPKNSLIYTCNIMFIVQHENNEISTTKI